MYMELPYNTCFLKKLKCIYICTALTLASLLAKGVLNMPT